MAIVQLYMYIQYLNFFSSFLILCVCVCVCVCVGVKWYLALLSSTLFLLRALLACSDDGLSDLFITICGILHLEHISSGVCLSQGPVCYETSVSLSHCKREYYTPLHSLSLPCSLLLTSIPLCFINHSILFPLPSLPPLRISIRRDAAVQKEIAKELGNKSTKQEKDAA